MTVDGQPLLEAAGISYTEMDSMQPIYGYCSRLFDAVAPGQKIIQGSIVVNLVDPDYLFESALQGRRMGSVPQAVAFGNPPTGKNLDSVWRNREGVDSNDISSSGYTSDVAKLTSGDFAGVSAALESKYWGSGATEAATAARRGSPRMTDPSLLGPTDISIEFANDFAIVLYSCFFVSKGSAIQIDENVILEEHTFFARASATQDLFD